MSERGDWLRVRRDRLCPICEKSDWCLIARDGSAAICARIESPKRAGQAGYLHKLTDDRAERPNWRTRRIPFAVTPTIDFGALAERWAAALTPDALADFAASLGVSRDALARLGVGWSPEQWSFPMYGPDEKVCGIRLRLSDGRKLSVRGGREGLFVPRDLPAGGRLYVCEGPTDTAALLTLGLAAIGRPSCAGRARLVVRLARGRDVVVVADADEPGQRGAYALACVLAAYCLSVRVITPPAGAKDAREWLRLGATADDVLTAVRAARPLGITVKAARRT